MTGTPRRAIGRRDVLFLLASACMAVLFIRLGLWQLHRLQERRVRNALVIARLSQPAIPLAILPRDTGLARYRTVRVAGDFDFDHEIVFVNRIREGAPGVQILTPVRVQGMDTGVLVDRGWVYAPDAETVDRAAWREPAGVDALGYVQELPTPGRGNPSLPAHPDQFRWLDPAAISKVTGYPVAPFYVVLTGDTAVHAPHVPTRVPPPPLDEGPHLSYAIQWFAFALIAIGGSAVAIFGAPRAPLDDLSAPRSG
jgi:surfeit locus 1 family protein